MSFWRIGIFGVFLVITGPLLAAPKAIAPAAEGGQYGFAESLFGEGDYYRAIGEYKRLLFQFPSSLRKFEVEYKIGICYLMGKRFAEAINSFDLLLGPGITEVWKEKADMKIGDVYYVSGEYEKSVAHWDQLIQRHPQSSHKPRALYMSGWAQVRRGRFQEARERFLAAAAVSEATDALRSSAEQAARDIHSSLPVANRSPWVAGLASALIPGLGQLYCGRTGDAVSAFVVTGLCGWLTYDAIRREDKSMGVFWGVLTGIFYGGNIYGGIASADRFGRKVQSDFTEHLEGFKLLSVEEAF